MKNSLLNVIVTGCLFVSVISTSVAETYIFPANGQSAEQQQQDEYSCHSWAVSETGIDPTKTQESVPQSTAPAAQPSPQGATPGSGARGAVRGAAAGAIIAEIGDNDTGNGAARGAAIGMVGARAKSRRANHQAAEQQAQQQAAQQQQVQQASQTQIDEYNKARNVCLEAKGYTVSD